VEILKRLREADVEKTWTLAQWLDSHPW
jgi:hypothetical protein